MILATGSQLDRLVRCEASGALPQIVDASDDEDATWRARGTAIHRFLQRVPEVGYEQALAETDDEWRPLCADVELGKLVDQLQMSRELAIAYDWKRDTARLLTPATPRAYEIDPTCETAATLDLGGVNAAHTVVYSGDYKGPHAWLPEPEQSYQLGLGAVALSRLFGATSAKVEYIRIRDDGSVRKFWAELDVFGLDAAAAKIAKLLSGLPPLRARIEAGLIPDVTEGRWCRYCPARMHCPSKTALVRRVLNDPQPIPYLQPLTPESAARAYAMLKPAKAALKQIEAALATYAKYTPIHIETEADGSERYYGELRRPGSEVLDGAITHSVLTELYDGETANRAVTLDTTKTAIATAVRAAMPAGDKITHHTDRVYELVRERGGSKRPETTTTTEYSVAPDGAAKAKRRKA